MAKSKFGKKITRLVETVEEVVETAGELKKKALEVKGALEDLNGDEPEEKPEGD